MGGSFQTSRDIFEHPIWQDVTKFRIFFYIYGQAVFSEEGVKYGGVHIKRGQYLRSYRNLRKDLEYIENRKVKSYSLAVISRKIDKLVEEKRLIVEDTELGTLFTVLNYEKYQGFGSVVKEELGTPLEQGWNTVGTEMEQHRNNNNKDKKDKKVKKDYKNIIVEVIEHLNLKSDSKFNPEAKGTAKDIKARIEEGFTLEDFKMVIDYCCREWKGKVFENGKRGDTYLRPSTLFNGKFDERLNRAKKQPNTNIGSHNKQNDFTEEPDPLKEAWLKKLKGE